MAQQGDDPSGSGSAYGYDYYYQTGYPYYPLPSTSSPPYWIPGHFPARSQPAQSHPYMYSDVPDDGEGTDMGDSSDTGTVRSYMTTLSLTGQP